jgi:hypothetical protein
VVIKVILAGFRTLLNVSHITESTVCILFNIGYVHISGSPCLSFDVIRDSLGEKRELHPLCAYVVAGTQAPRTHINNVLVMKVRKNLYSYNMVTSCSQSRMFS